MFDMQSWPKQVARMNTKTRQIKKGGRDTKYDMIQILANDKEHQLGMLKVKGGNNAK